MSYSEFHTLRDETPRETAENALHDENGTRLYETEEGNLFWTIIANNDTSTLKQYLSVYSPRLDVEQNPLYERGCSLLRAACGEAQLETARLILDTQPALNSAAINQVYRDEALLAAAKSLCSLTPCGRNIETPEACERWVRSRTAQAEELIHLLLDAGASVQATDPLEENHPKCYGTVLGRASSRATPWLIKRLIEAGADIHASEDFQLHSTSRPGCPGDAPGMTAFHIASAYWNSDALQILLEGTPETADLRDGFGRLPLHWAATGPGSWECWLPDENVNKRILGTLSLLCSSDLDINARDNWGRTALHYAVCSHAGCGQSIHVENMLNFLLERGADAGLVDENNQTVLHKMAYYCLEGDPINTCLLQLLISHGAEINQQDVNGNTALHLLARNLRQSKATQFLISQGAEESLINGNGNTALHECFRMGTILAGETSNGPVRPTVDEKRKAMDKMVNILCGGGDDMMEQANYAGETPRQLLKGEEAGFLEGMGCACSYEKVVEPLLLQCNL